MNAEPMDAEARACNGEWGLVRVLTHSDDGQAFVRDVHGYQWWVSESDLRDVQPHPDDEEVAS